MTDRLGYHMVAAHISEAIDALNRTARSEQELAEMDLAEDERVHMILVSFEKYKHLDLRGERPPEER